MGPTLRAAVWDFLPLWNNSALQMQYSLKLKSSVGHKLVKIWTLWFQPKVLLSGVSRYTWSTVNKSQPCQSSRAFWDWTIQPALSPFASLLSSFILLSFRFHSNLVLISLSSALRCIYRSRVHSQHVQELPGTKKDSACSRPTQQRFITSYHAESCFTTNQLKRFAKQPEYYCFHYRTPREINLSLLSANPAKH